MIKPAHQIQSVIKRSSKNIKRASRSSSVNNNTQARLQQINLQSQVLQCRICLQTSEESLKSFIKPCSCSGSISYVHKCCLQTWIKQRINKANPLDQQTYIDKQSIGCQMCKTQIPFQFDWKMKQITLSGIYQKAQAKVCVATLLASAFFLIVIALCFVARMISDIGINLYGSHQIESVILMVSLIIMPLFLMIVLYLMLDQFVFSYQYVIRITGVQHPIQLFLPARNNTQQNENRLNENRLDENNQAKNNKQGDSNQDLIISNTESLNIKVSQRNSPIIIEQIE